MSGVNTGILINAYPLTAEQIAEVEAKVFTTNGTYAFLSDNRELCFAFPWGVDDVKELAWHQAWELSIEDSLYVKRIYKKKSQREYYLWKTLYKNSLDEPWPDDPAMTQLDPAEITLDGDILNIFDASGLATSATIFVNGIPMHTVEIKGEAKEPLDPKYNHYGTIPEGCSYWSYANDSGYGAGDPFPELNESDDYTNSDGLMYRYYDGAWTMTESDVGMGVQPGADGTITILESINGAPVTAIIAFGHAGMPPSSPIYGLTTLIIPTSITSIESIAGATELTQIVYLGTMEQWNAIELGANWTSSWNGNSCPAFTVSCTDGPIAIPAYGA